MKPLPSLAVLTILLAAPALGQTGPTDCDRLAGMRYAPRVPDAGGATIITRAPEAVAACEAAAALHPADPHIALQLGRAYLAADPADPRAEGLFTSALAALPALARLRLGTLHDNGWSGLQRNLPKALSLYEEACALAGQPGALVACNNVALVLLEGTDAAQYPRAIALMEAGCAAGDPYSCENLGFEYETGAHVPRDRQRAAALYRQACDADSPLGCSNLGNAVSEGFDGPPDLPLAQRLFRRACDLGEMLGCSNLGWALWQGFDGPENPEAALPLFEQACAAEVGVGCGNLGDFLYDGIVVAQDFTEAARLYGLGCDQGDGWSCLQLGLQLRGGTGVPQDDPRGQALIRQGCALGDSDACAMAASLP
ncbi:tetratricopeptide repeat protein [Pararhodobacter sp.]|uniref:tetratricopeptide repeat protein n=1 Tax=Pararhodobacter sp. TaxID=2127056 RepID=UPI002AFFCA18|nr:tetratricopeptide repeat protein [Pararhodobacter sp.]